MKEFAHTFYQEADYYSKITVEVHRAGGRPVYSVAPGIDSRGPVIQVGIKSGTERNNQGHILQGITPNIARTLARLLLDAADWTEEGE